MSLKCLSGAALHRWEEVTAAGLLLLAAAKTFHKRKEAKKTKKTKKEDTEDTEVTQKKEDPNEEFKKQSTESKDDSDSEVNDVKEDFRSPAILVYGACDGLLASFLAQHAPEARRLHGDVKNLGNAKKIWEDQGNKKERKYKKV